MVECVNTTSNITIGNTTSLYCGNYSTTESTDVWVPPAFDASVKNITLAIVLTIIDVVTIFGNLLVLVAFVADRKLFHPFNMFIFNLAVTDFLVAITAMTFYTIDTLLGYWPFGSVMCGLWIYFDFAMTFASVFTLVAISIDRFWCVTWAMHYRINNNKTKTVIILAIIWFCVIAIWTPPFIGDRLKHNEPHMCIWEPSDNTEFVIFVAGVGHYIPCMIMVFCYIKVFMLMRRQVAIVGNMAVPTTSRNIDNKMTGSLRPTLAHDNHAKGKQNPHHAKQPRALFSGNSSSVSNFNTPPSIHAGYHIDSHLSHTGTSQGRTDTNATSSRYVNESDSNTGNSSIYYLHVRSQPDNGQVSSLNIPHGAHDTSISPYAEGSESHGNTESTHVETSDRSRDIPKPVPGQSLRPVVEEPSTTSQYSTSSRSHQGHHAREKRIFITLTYVLCSYLICWLPFYIAFDTYAWKPSVVPADLYTFFFWMTYVNSTLNPFIYAYTSKEFRSAFIKVLSRMCKCSKF